MNAESASVTGVMGEAMFKISEHWNIKGDKALSIWVVYYQLAALMALIEHNRKTTQ